MPKGYHDETCAEAIKAVLKEGEIINFSELFKRVKQRGNWKDDTVWQHLMQCVVNIPPARYHWKNSKPFLFLHEDGRYELFNPTIHPKPSELDF